MQKIWNGKYFQTLTYFLIMACNCRLKIVFLGIWFLARPWSKDHKNTTRKVVWFRCLIFTGVVRKMEKGVGLVLSLFMHYQSVWKIFQPLPKLVDRTSCASWNICKSELHFYPKVFDDITAMCFHKCYFMFLYIQWRTGKNK